MSAKMTPAEAAYAAFAAQPLAALYGVDRASFCAGYDTALQDSAVPELVAALQMALKCAEEGTIQNDTAWEDVARAALAKAVARAQTASDRELIAELRVALESIVAIPCFHTRADLHEAYKSAMTLARAVLGKVSP